MTNYIEEMMRIAGIKKRTMCAWTCKGSDLCNVSCEHYETKQEVYPPFTPEKQLEIIKLIFKKCFIDIQDNNIKFTYHDSPVTYNMDLNDFAQNLAALVNNIWRNLTEEDKEKVRRILEG